MCFSLKMLLFATAAYNFWTSERPKVLPDPQFFNIFTSECVFHHSGVQFFDIVTSKSAPDTFASKCSFHHSGVQFLIYPLTTWLRTRRFNRPTFRLTRHTNHRENTAFRDLSNIWRGCIFFLLTFALLHLLSADLTTLLCFSTVHIVGSFYLNFLTICLMNLFPTCEGCDYGLGSPGL